MGLSSPFSARAKRAAPVQSSCRANEYRFSTAGARPRQEHGRDGTRDEDGVVAADIASDCRKLSSTSAPAPAEHDRRRLEIELAQHEAERPDSMIHTSTTLLLTA